MAARQMNKPLLFTVFTQMAAKGDQGRWHVPRQGKQYCYTVMILSTHKAGSRPALCVRGVVTLVGQHPGV